MLTPQPLRNHNVESSVPPSKKLCKDWLGPTYTVDLNQAIPGLNNLMGMLSVVVGHATAVIVYRGNLQGFLLKLESQPLKCTP